MKRLIAALVTALACLLSVPTFAANSGQLTNGRQQFVNASGSPLAAGTVSVYQAGTSTPVSTYQDPGLTSANTWPIVLDSNGMASIWLPPGNYREVVQDALGVTLFDQTTSTTGTPSSLPAGTTVNGAAPLTDFLQWQNYTPTPPTPAGGSFGAASYSVAQYARMNRTIFYEMQVNVTNLGTATGCVTVGLPVASAGNNISVGQWYGSNGGSGYAAVSTSVSAALVCTYSGGAPFTTTGSVTISGFYVAAS